MEAASNTHTKLRISSILKADSTSTDFCAHSVAPIWTQELAEQQGGIHKTIKISYLAAHCSAV